MLKDFEKQKLTTSNPLHLRRLDIDIKNCKAIKKLLEKD